MNITVLQEIPDDAEFAASWNSLAMGMERPEVFFTYQWAVAASHAFAETVWPLICLVYDSGRLCGIAPLATGRKSRRRAYFLTSSTADYCDVLSEPIMRGAVLSAVLDEIKNLGVQDLELANIPSDSATLRELAGIARSQDFHLYERAAYDCGLIILGDDQDRQTLLQTIRRKDREKRGLKKMAKIGCVRVTHASPDEIEPELRSICAAQISRFLTTKRVSPLVRPERRAFLTELAQRLSAAGWLRISRLEVSRHPVAWNYGFRFCDSWFWYLPTFEIQHEDLSPGSCLLRLLVEEGCDDPSLKRLDLGLGDEAYKERFANALVLTRQVHLSRNRLRHGQTVARHWVSANVKRSQLADSTIRGMRDRFRDLCSRVRSAGVMKTGTQLLRRANRCVRSTDEVLLFEAPAIQMEHSAGATLHPLEWQHISDAAVINANDGETLGYLMRCASRLKEGGASGFVFLGPGAQARHFLWVRPYDGFYLSEVNHKLESPDPGATLIFDCWTPVSQRGNGYYADGIRLAAANLQREQKTAWIFAAKENETSVRGIVKAGFAYRFSLLRKSLFGVSKVAQRATRQLG